MRQPGESDLLRACMPDWIPGDPKHPGSPCYIEPEHVAGDRYVEEVRGQVMPAMCLTCGRTQGPPWWMRPDLVWGWPPMIEP